MPGALKIQTVYHSPDDFPGLYVLREFTVEEGVVTPSATAHTRDSLEAIRALLPRGLVRMNRNPEDHPSVVELWL